MELKAVILCLQNFKLITNLPFHVMYKGDANFVINAQSIIRMLYYVIDITTPLTSKLSYKSISDVQNDIL